MTASEKIKVAVMGLQLSSVGKKLLMIEGSTPIDNTMLLSTAKEIVAVCDTLAELLNEDSTKEESN